jgi:xylulokinase
MVTFLQYSDFILYRLTGEKAVDWSLASRTLVFNVTEKRWDPVLLEAAGLRADQFPRPVQAGVPLAPVLPSVAREIGLTERTVALLGGQDQIGAVVGGGAMEPGVALNGTGSVDCITPIFDAPNTGQAMRRFSFACVPFIRPDYYVTYAFSFYGGALLKWYRDRFGQAAMAAAAARNMSVYAYLESTAPPEPTGILVLPHFSGAATPYMDIHSVGAVVGLTADTDGAALYRALMEGVAYEMRVNLDCLREAGVPVRRLIASGGGSRSPMWMQMRADLFDLPVAVPEVEEAGTLGAAVMAGAACGVYRDVADGVKRLVRIRRTYTPDPVRHEQYMEIFERYRRMYRCVKQIMGRNEE